MRDSGVGFRPADGPRLFEKFTRLHPGGGSSYYGTGLGPVHRAPPDAARAGPRQRAQRRAGPGRALRARLACRRGAALVSTEAPVAPRVLVVEDDPHLAAGVVENLRAEGYEVDAATDGEQALEWLAGAGCALIVLDVMLPGIDGFARVPHAARAGQQHAGAVPDRARRSGRPRARPGGRRRRLPRQALSPAGISAARARDPAALGLVSERLGDRGHRGAAASAATRWISAPSAPAPGTAWRRS